MQKRIPSKQIKSIMSQKQWTYVPGPRMGTNNFMYGVELSSFPSSKKTKIVTQGGKKK